jgi:hypothetical protein
MTSRIFTALVIALVSASNLEAQLSRAMGGGGPTRRVDSIIPQSGPVGTEVVLKAWSMPAITPLRVGFGSTLGFEAYDMVLSTDKGELTMRATVPAWATWDKTYRLIVFNVYFQPIALSDPFYVTNAEGLLMRRGVVSREKPECVTFTDTGGEVHSLTGEIAALKTGDVASIEGTFTGASKCATGAAIRVARIR